MATRIYQGRIVSARFEDSSVSENPYRALETTHRLFQDAVNYHIVALAGMADASDTASVGGRFRERVKNIWTEHPKGHTEATTLQKSLCRTLNLNKQATFKEVVDDIFHGCEAADALPYALQFILDKTEKGEGVIQQQGRELLPKLCDPAFSGNFDFSKKGKLAANGLKRLTELCTNPNATQEDYQTFARDMDLSWAGIKTQTGKYWNQEETGEQITEAIRELCSLLATHSDNAWNKLNPAVTEEDIKKLTATTKADTSHLLAKNAKAVLVLKYAAILFMYYPCRITAQLLAAKLPKLPKVETDATDKPYNYAQRDEDPLEEARGQRGFIYRGFTALPDWETEGATMYEKGWDILAFKEALKAIHGFELKTTERETERRQLQKRLEYLLGTTDKRVQDDEESEAVAVLGGDIRFELLQELVQELKQETDDREYYISRRAIKSGEEIFRTWKEMDARGADTAELQQAVKDIQARNGQDFGSQPLFHHLAMEKYHPIWKSNGPQDGKTRSTDILRDFSHYQRLCDDIEALSVPVRLTAAEAHFSPRALTYSDLTKLGGKNTGCRHIKREEGGMILGVCVRNAKGRWEGRELHVTYSAPRMLRDCIGVDAAAWTSGKGSYDTLSSWLQPLAKALETQTSLFLQREPAVTLATGGTDKKGNPICYLNFPVTLDMTPLQQAIGKAGLWAGQFLGMQDEKLHLHWPGTYKGRNIPWWQNEEIQRNGITVLGVDLGVRYAAAWSLVRGETTAEKTGAKGQNIRGRLLGTADGQAWYGYVCKQGILRLPGEGHQQKTKKDGTPNQSASALSTQGIRLATAEEREEYAAIAKCIKKEPAPLKDDATILELNRQMARLFHGLLSRYRVYLRLCHRLHRDQDQAIVEAKDYFFHNDATRNYIPKLTEKLEQGDAETAISLLLEETERLRTLLPRLAERITTLLLPRKHDKWTWVPEQRVGCIGSGSMQLTEAPCDRQGRNTTKIYATGGLSMARLSLLEDWRKQLQSLNRLLMTTPGTEPLNGRESRFAKVIDPCPTILEKIDEIREQRVNQIAHGIVAQALGLRLKEPSQRENKTQGKDILHGEYERIPNRQPVDVVIMENLSRYLMREERSRDENSTLMRWAHRQIVAKTTQLLEEVFGIPVLFTHAAYTSKFDSLSSAVGFRADSLKLSDFTGWHLNHLEQELAPKALSAYKDILSHIKEGNAPRGFSLYCPSPQNGGEYFISEDTDGIHLRNADMNAATNIAWRGLASPEALPLLHRVRMAKAKNGHICTRRENAREKCLTAKDFTECRVPEDVQEQFTAFFAPSPSGQPMGYLLNQPLEYGKKLWGTLKSRKWDICHRLNIRLLRKAGFDTTILELATQQQGDDDIPL